MPPKRRPLPPCERCGNESAETCHLCSRKLCEDCLDDHGSCYRCL
jgi:hypothetical protein